MCKSGVHSIMSLDHHYLGFIIHIRHVTVDESYRLS